MLKLEKKSRYASLEVMLREKERFFNPILLKALLFAILLHISAFFLFHIQPFKLTSFFLFPPIEVKMENETSLPSPLLLYQKEISEEFTLPPLTVPLDPILLSRPNQITASTPTLETTNSAFESLEKFHWPKHSFSSASEKPIFQFTISGELANYTLVKGEPKQDNIITSTSPIYVTYQVKVEDKSGTIFWYEKIQNLDDQNMNHLLEKILLDLQFDTSSVNSILTGFIHFVIN